MARRLYEQIRRQREAEVDDNLTNVEAIVADNGDPERRHRIKVVIPSMDENIVRDEWVEQLGVYVGGPGFGSFYLPAIGSEVRLFGRLGQKYNLAYLCVYNEDFVVPPDFENCATCGCRVPGDLKLIAEGDVQLRGGGIQIETDGAVNIIASAGFFVNGKPV